jgi:hypothetical protein
MQFGIHVVDCKPGFLAFNRTRATILSVRDVAMKLPVWTRKFQLGLEGTGFVTIVVPDGAGPDLIAGREVDIDIGLGIVRPFDGDPIISCGPTPSGRAASLLYPGSRNEAAIEMHQAIRDWCAANDETLAGPVWEQIRFSFDPEWRETRIFYMLG